MARFRATLQNALRTVHKSPKPLKNCQPSESNLISLNNSYWAQQHTFTLLRECRLNICKHKVWYL